MNKYTELVEASRDLQEVMKLTSMPLKFAFAKDKGIEAEFGGETLDRVHARMKEVHARWNKAVGAFNE